VAENEERGIIVMGDSGEDDGDGSVKEDESVVEIVVVGDESVDSEACVDVESLCLCFCGLVFGLMFSFSCGGRRASSASALELPSIVVAPPLPIPRWSNPYTLINDGK
jgi:hypothetical protein